MFAFVTVTHPDDFKDQKRQGKLRRHAIRNGIKKSRVDRAKEEGIFVHADIDEKTGQLRKWAPPKVGSLMNSPSISLLDPFNTLSGCPERLRALMRHPSAKQAGEPIFCIQNSGKLRFQGMDTIFKGALTDPSLFHALSLVLSLAANNNMPNLEILTYRGELLNSIQVNIHGLKGAPQVSTLTAMLLLIGYEYRIDGSNCETIATHINGVRTMMTLCKLRNVPLVDEVQRALFWQDLLSCLMAGTPRILSHNDFQDYKTPENAKQLEKRAVPLGFQATIVQWPEDFALVLQDLDSLCRLVDIQCNSNERYLDTCPIDNDQANLESRLVDLLNECKHSLHEFDHWCEASILCAYVCTYQLSTGIWTNCFIPEVCMKRILELVAQNTRGSYGIPVPDLVLWLLFICGGLTNREILRTQTAQLIHEIFPSSSEVGSKEWEELILILRTFIWCDHSMERKIFTFWNDVYLQKRYWTFGKPPH